MIGQRVQGLIRIQLACQVALAAILFIVMFFGMELTQGRLSDDVRERYPIYWTLVVGTLLLLGLYSASDADSGSLAVELSALKKVSIAARQTMIVACVLLLFLVATKDAAISRIFLFAYIAVLYPALYFSHVFLPRWLATFIFRHERIDRTLLVGRSTLAQNLEGWLSLKRHVGFRVVGILTDETEHNLSVPSLGRVQDLVDTLSKHRISQVIVLGVKGANLDHLIQQCEHSGVRLLIYNDLEEELHRPLIHFRDEGKYFIALRKEPLENPFSRAIKRAFDIVVAIPVALFILPLCSLAVWVIHRIQSPGPLFYRQQRSGFQQVEFEILKFRTMHPVAHDETKQATRGDERIFPLGRFLRRYSFDEFPQFLNVLGGEMSLIGPRPHLPEHNQQFAEAVSHYHGRNWIKPGITGLAQVRGFRGEVTSGQQLQSRVASDFEYIENWTLALDIAILFRTFWQIVFPPPTAY
jgi:exopolysaccharide biosynthesis polyprenyl glycosylphosphotransferase